MIKKDDGDLMHLWVKYKEDRDTQIRNELIVYYSDLVNRVVNRIAVKYRDYIDVDDLISYGVFGLIDAIDKFDIDKGVKFETYASFRIRGAIIDQIREQDWIPRNLRAKAKEMETALEELELKLGRKVEDQELAEHLGITIDELHNLMGQFHSFSVLSLDEQILDIISSPTLLATDNKTPEEHIMVEELKDILSQAIDLLSDNERKIIGLYYFDELTLKEIGIIIGVSESRVSQLHTRALIKLKNRLKRAKIFSY